MSSELQAIQTVLGILMIIVGWRAVDELTRHRDTKNKRREISTSFLIDAYRRLESSSYRLHTNDTLNNIESAVSDILLFGSSELITLASQYVEALKSDVHAPPLQLLLQLRKELRQELELPDAGADGQSLRFHHDAIFENPIYPPLPSSADPTQPPIL